MLHWTFLLTMIVALLGCGVKGPPLPPVPTTPQDSDPALLNAAKEPLPPDMEIDPISGLPRKKKPAKPSNLPPWMDEEDAEPTEESE